MTAAARPAAAVLAWLAAMAAAAAGPVAGDCGNDAPGLVQEAEALLASGRSVSGSALERARQLYRRARLLAPSPTLSLRAADLAAAAGDAEEEGDLLSEASETGPGLLSAPERLELAVRAQARGRWRDAAAEYERLRDTLTASGQPSDWIEAPLTRLRLEAEAQAIAAPSSTPPPEARLALADGKRALVAGRLREARARLRLALEIAPGYVEALLALGAVETRDGRPAEAIRAYRAVLAAEPDRFEARVALAGVLWDEPSRAAKLESLELIDRAADERPDLPALMRLSAARWAEWGDPVRALTRLDVYRERVPAEERRQTDALRASLQRRLHGEPETVAASQTPEVPTEAVEHWRKAQVYVQRGDAASLDAALSELAEAQRLDPKLSRAAELEATIHERRSQGPEAEAALRRAIAADPSRAAGYERLAHRLESDPVRAAEAEEMWRKADEAGSPEAAFALAGAALRSGRRREAAALLRRYQSQSPGGVHADEAARSLDRLEKSLRVETTATFALLAAALLAGSTLFYRRIAGRSFREWLARDPSRARLARPIVGRLRHEALKHGGLLLTDAAERLKAGDRTVQRQTASLLLARLYGEKGTGTRGLVAESFEALRELVALARQRGVRLNLRYRDPIFSRILRGLAHLQAARPDLVRLASEAEAPARSAPAVAQKLEAAARCFGPSVGAELEKVLDETSALPVHAGALQALLRQVAAEKHLEAPALETVGEAAPETSKLSVRVAPNDWETIWRNLFGNALAAGQERGVAAVRLGLAIESRRDPVTQERRLRVCLADNLPGALTTEMIRGRAADRGWGVVADLVRRHDGSVDVGPPPDSSAGFVKSIVLEFPAL